MSSVREKILSALRIARAVEPVSVPKAADRFTKVTEGPEHDDLGQQPRCGWGDNDNDHENDGYLGKFLSVGARPSGVTAAAVEAAIAA